MDPNEITEHQVEDIISKVVDRRREPKEKSSAYVMSIVAIASVAMICIALVSIFSPSNTNAVIIISALVGTVIPNVINILKSNENGNHTKQLREALNGRLKDFLQTERELAWKKGKETPRTPRPGQEKV